MEKYHQISQKYVVLDCARTVIFILRLKWRSTTKKDWGLKILSELTARYKYALIKIDDLSPFFLLPRLFYKKYNCSEKGGEKSEKVI